MQPVKTTPLFAIGYQKPLQTHDVQHVITIPCSQSDTSILIRPLMRSKLNPLSLSAVGYPKPPQTHDVQQVKTTPLFAVGYQKPQKTHNLQPVKTTPLFAVGYQKPQQTHYVQLVNTTPLFAIGYQKPLQTHDVQHVITIPCSQSDTSILIRPLMRSKLNPLSLSSFGYLKSLQATDV